MGENVKCSGSEACTNNKCKHINVHERYTNSCDRAYCLCLNNHGAVECVKVNIDQWFEDIIKNILIKE